MGYSDNTKCGTCGLAKRAPGFVDCKACMRKKEAKATDIRPVGDVEGDYEVVWNDRAHKTQRKVFKNDPQGTPGNGEIKARAFAKKLESDDAKDKYGDIRGRVTVRATDIHPVGDGFQGRGVTVVVVGGKWFYKITGDSLRFGPYDSASEAVEAATKAGHRRATDSNGIFENAKKFAITVKKATPQTADDFAAFYTKKSPDGEAFLSYVWPEFARGVLDVAPVGDGSKAEEAEKRKTYCEPCWNNNHSACKGGSCACKHGGKKVGDARTLESLQEEAYMLGSSIGSITDPTKKYPAQKRLAEVGKLIEQLKSGKQGKDAENKSIAPIPKMIPRSKRPKAEDSEKDGWDVDTDKGAAKIVKREARAGLSVTEIVKKYGFSKSFVEEEIKMDRKRAHDALDAVLDRKRAKDAIPSVVTIRRQQLNKAKSGDLDELQRLLIGWYNHQPTSPEEAALRKEAVALGAKNGLTRYGNEKA